MEANFHEMARVIDGALQAGEAYTASFAAEDTDFVRFNGGRVRQPGSVRQSGLSIDLIRGRRHAVHSLTLSGDVIDDSAQVRRAVADLRTALADVEDDPFLLYATEVRSSRTVRDGRLLEAGQAVDAIVESARGLDMVGIYAAGRIC
ncbi:MAG: TldD/PmbA family protein, partial [Betaproteobacteria bacterium]